jgi:hypothetical protein
MSDAAMSSRLDGSHEAGTNDGTNEEAAWRRRVIGRAAAVQAFDADDFGGGDVAAIAAGALAVASTIFIDEVIEDITTLAHRGGTVADSDGAFLAFAELPPRFAHHYDGRFARKFLVATVAVTGRLVAARWEWPACVAEALALHVVVRRAGELLTDHECLDEQLARDVYAGFEDAAFEDADHELLYQPDLSGGAVTRRLSAGPLSWFDPISTAAVHPFTVESEVATAGE